MFGMGICRKFSSIENHIIRFTKFLKLLCVRADEHVVHEQRVIGPAGNDSNLDPVFRIPTGKAAINVNPFSDVQIVDRPFSDNYKCILIDANVDISPPDVVYEFRCGYDSLVFGASSSFF